MKAPKVIAEIGCNHKGEMDIARDMIGIIATFGKADVAKFQKRSPREILSPQQCAAPHPNPANSYGATYGEHREFLEFSLDQHKELKDCCEGFGIDYSTSVWDLTSAKEIASIEPRLIKVGSASNLHFEMLGYLCDNFGGEIHLSVGMTSRDEEEQIVAFFENRNRARDLVIYSCTSGYPVEFGDICLREISRLRDAYGDRAKAIGFSGHHLGISADVAAMTLGAEWIERHFTLDRTWKGTDHAASLEPDGLRRLVRDLSAVAKALEFKPTEILDVEQPQRAKLKWSTAEVAPLMAVGAN
ncbi:MAG: N-acetylneuraminate synthase [Alphaproteobacteria bacterium]|nr:N-acetylneuraminate synthase [Alphaproteobacteria bacterium]